MRLVFMSARNSSAVKSARNEVQVSWVEVYRARDEKLNREVAIKVLPTAFSSDKDRYCPESEIRVSLGQVHSPQQI